ncbi:MAG TPA: hypothetical protein VNY75_05955, partial [Rhizomicrobium sp.]|nr:hypothetical protein [Rhizomicrobium sp.]
WALPLSIAAFVLIALGGSLTPRGRRALPRPVLAGLMPGLLLAGCIGMGFVLHGLAAWISGHPDPSFAHPVWLRLALGFGALAVALPVARLAGGAACWLWFSGLAVLCAVWAPGLAPYFLFPSLVAAPLLLVTVRGGREGALFVSALAALIVWIGLNAGGEAIMGLKMHPLFMASAGFGLLALLPLLGRVKDWRQSFAVSLSMALVLAVIAGLQPAYSVTAPERLNLRYVEMDGKAGWLADPVTRLPDSLRTAANFSARPQRLVGMGYVAPAGLARNPAPGAAVSRSGDTVTLDLNATADGVMLVVPVEAKLQALTIGGVTTRVSERRVSIICGTPDCAHARITLRLGSSQALSLLLVAQRRGLPLDGAKLLKARPAEAVPSQEGDSTLLAAKIAIPAG